MANLYTAAQKAETLSPRARKTAAGLYFDVETELSLGDVAGGEEAAGEHALEILSRRFPGVEEQAHDIHDRPPNLSSKTKDNVHAGRRRRASSRSGRTSSPAPSPRPTRPAPAPRAGRTRRILDADLPSVSLPSGSGSQLVVQFFTWAAGLSLFYLFLTHSKASDNFAAGFVNTTRALVSTSIDPLNPHPARKPTVRTVRPATRATAGLPASGFSHQLAVSALAAKKAQ